LFDINDTDSTRVQSAFPDEGAATAGAVNPSTTVHPLDNDIHQTLQKKLVSFYRQELDRQEENRAEMAVDEDYYDNIQWSEDEIEVLRERGQAPTVYNVISQSINWILGSEKRGRVDFKILPRRKPDGKPAERKTALMKYLSDVNHTAYERSRAFEEAVKAGIGWLETQYQDEDDGEPIYSGAESWRNILFDSTYRRVGMEDCRYIFRTKWVDLDVAVAMFPDRQAALEEAATDGYETWGADDEDGDDPMDSREYERSMSGGMRDSFEYSRKRVRLIECWFRKPVSVKKLKGRSSDFRGEVYDAEDERHQLEVAYGRAEVATGPMMRMHCAIMTTEALLTFGPSPYRHNRYPFTPVWGYRRARDGLPYGVTRFMRGMQDDVNKRMSKTLYILSSSKVIMDKGAVDDIEEFRAEVARPDSVIEKNPGKALEIDVDRDLAPAHLELASRSIQMIQQVGGVTDELLGRATNAVSGVAIEARQEQGSVGTSGIFDNLRLAYQMHGEKELSLIEQFMTEEKQFRITNSRGQPEYVNVNDSLPENDITRTKADFIVDEVDWRASMRQAAAAELMDLATKLPPEMVVSMMDLLVESLDIQNRDELVKRIRQINGQKDPDATEPTPEEIQKAEAQAKQAAYNDDLAMATLAEAKAKAKKAEADAKKAEADAIKAIADAKLSSSKAAQIDAQTVKTNIESIQGAMDAGQVATFMPEVAGVADALLEEAGFTGAAMPTDADPMASPFRPKNFVPNGLPGMGEEAAAPPAEPMGPADGLPPMMPPDGEVPPAM
jgi:hypothetical protein